MTKHRVKITLIPDGIKKALSSQKLTINFVAILLILLTILAVNIAYFANRIYPGVYIAGINVSGLTTDEAFRKIEKNIGERGHRILSFTDKQYSQQFEINLSNITFDLNTQEAIQAAQEFGHKKFFVPPVNLEIKESFGNSLDQNIDEIAKIVDQPPIDSEIKIDGEQISVTSSQNGLVLDKVILKQRIARYLETSKLPVSILPFKKVGPKLSYESALEIKKRLENIKQSPIKFQFKDQEFILDLPTILSLIDLKNSDQFLVQGEFLNQKFNLVSASLGDEELTDSRLTLNNQKITEYFKTLSLQTDRNVREPLFAFNNGKVTQFQPPQEGYTLNITKASILLNEALMDNKKTISLPVDITKPKNKLVNDLGIKELLGRGISYFVGSIPNRVYNIALTASKLNGITVPPGETFSFNQTVGDISAASGYKQAYVIKSGRTVLDDGGGVCQDSTTLFRAVLNAGLPVVDRTAHAYRVGYYEQGFAPGLDATVFSPSVDFKFKNDTPAHILIQAYVYGNTLYIDLYGTSDGRISNISTPVVTNRTPAPPDLRQDDPTLPKGEVKQVDFAASGANVVFSRTVTRDNQTLINETFRSNYRPWQAVFLVGTKE